MGVSIGRSSYDSPVITVGIASEAELDRLVDLETSLFEEDAGQHDQYADVTWPRREGRTDFERLVRDPHALVLVASIGGSVVGHLVAYLAKSSPTRQPVTYAVLRSMYVEPEQRNNGIGQMLTERFLDWARLNECVEAHVDCYSANAGAQRFYERVGFVAQSVSRAMPLT
jgi:GNAT superfamily N-acetyltransferase